MLELTTLK